LAAGTGSTALLTEYLAMSMYSIRLLSTTARQWFGPVVALKLLNRLGGCRGLAVVPQRVAS